MITTGFLIALAVAVVVILVRALLSHHRASVPRLEVLDDYTRPVDLAAFRNLIDPAEEEFLREHLPAGKFHSVQRQRLRAALEYVERTSYNASILLRVGEAARRDSNPEIAAAATELVNHALQLGINARLATVALYGRILLPDARISVGRKVTETYEHLTEGLVRFTRLQDPAAAARISAAV